MSILSGPEIVRQMSLGTIEINPFDPARVRPNSYDVALGEVLLMLDDALLDIAEPPKAIREYRIPPEGFVLHPGIGYLGHTIERIASRGFVPWIDGRSTLGRFFVTLHQTAGKGDDNWNGTFTCEIMAVHRPVRIYAGVPVGQVSFFRLEGTRMPYVGTYLGQTGPRPPKAMK